MFSKIGRAKSVCHFPPIDPIYLTQGSCLFFLTTICPRPLAGWCAYFLHSPGNCNDAAESQRGRFLDATGDGRWASDGNGATATRRRRRPKATAPPAAALPHTLPIRHRRPPLLPLSAFASLRARPLADTAVSRSFALRRGGALVARGPGAAFHPWPRGTRRGYDVDAALVLLQLFFCSFHRSTARTRPFLSPRARCSGMERRGLRLLQHDRRAPAGHREVEGKVDGLRRKQRRLSRSLRTWPPRAMRRRRRARSRATNFATAHGEPAPDGVGRRTGHSTARDKARPRAARRTTGV